MSLGGDGVVLYANKFLRTMEMHSGHPPILSVNFGTLGFISQFAKEEFAAALESTFASSDSPSELMSLLCIPKVRVEVFSPSRARAGARPWTGGSANSS